MTTLNLLVFLLLLLGNGVHTQTKTKCPDPEEILPCECYEFFYPPTEFVCDNVTSNDQLSSIFNGKIRGSHFGRFTLRDNMDLEVIRAEDLGNCSFREIFMVGGSLKKIEPLTFAGSYSRATELMLPINNLVSFPFEELPNFRFLSALSFDVNDFTSFPELRSNSLLSFAFAENSIQGPLPANALKYLPEIYHVDLAQCNLTEILPGTFANSPYLSSLDLSGTNITKLPAGAIKMSHLQSKLRFSFNPIEHLDVDAFVGVTDSVEAIKCGLDVLEEDIWRPSLENGATLNLQDNPFKCGCDMAWLVLNATFMTQLTTETACDDGTRFTDLDPEDFVNC